MAGQLGSAAAIPARVHVASSGKPAAAAGSASAGRGRGPARPQGDAEFERLLQQLNLNSSWRGLLMRSLEGALEATGGEAGSRVGCAAEQPVTEHPAALPAAATAGVATATKRKPAAAAAQPLGASPRIAARRSTAHTAAEREPAVPAACAAPALAVADTMQHVIGRNKQLIQQQLAAAQAGAAAPRQRSGRRLGTVQAVEADCGSPVPAAAEDAEAVLDRLECHQWGAHSALVAGSQVNSSSNGGGGSSSSSGAGGRPASAGAEAAQAAHVLATQRSPSNSYDGWQEHGGSSHSGDRRQMQPWWEHAARDSRGSSGSWQSQPEGTQYEDDFESASQAGLLTALL